MNSFDKGIVVAARGSALSKAQVQEVLLALQTYHPEVVFSPVWIMAQGDRDQETSLIGLEKTDFFTKEIDEAVLLKKCRIAIHSAKDLPEIIPSGLRVVAYTKGIDPGDVLVLREGECIEELPALAKIGTSSQRRLENVHAILPNAIGVDIRGTIEKRLALLDEGKVDAVIMAKAALIRLLIERKTFVLPGPVAPLQGRLAIIAREDDLEMQELFSCLHDLNP